MPDSALKNVLNHILDSQEEMSTYLAALETALIANQLLPEGEVQRYVSVPRRKLANIRYWISNLPD